MFKEIEKELLSIISDEPIDRIANRPDHNIAKSMELLFNIKFEDIKRTYITGIGDISNLTVVYDAKDKKHITNDICPIYGKLYHIIFLPESLLSKNENNAIQLTRTIVTYVSSRISLLMDQYESIIKRANDNNVLYRTFLQAIPIITCSIMRRIYSGPTLPKLIYMSLTEFISTYKTLYTEEGVETILELFEEGLGIEDLLDNGFICSIKPDNSKYPGIWGSVKED